MLFYNFWAVLINRPDAGRAALPPSRVNRILHTLDSLGSSHTAPAREEVSHFIACFGVFGPTSPGSQSQSPVSSKETSVQSSASLDPSSPAAPTQVFQQTPESLPVGSLYDAWDEASCFHFSPPLGLEERRCDEPLSTSGEVSGSLESTFVNQDEAFLLDTGEEQTSHVSDAILDATSTSFETPFLLRPSRSRLSATAEFLLHQYCQRTMYLFCVVDHVKSPWKTIHVTKALQATGELTIRGSTSQIRESLISTLLAISSFFLANKNESQMQADQASTWRATASNYRIKAIELLRNAVESDFLGGSPPKYKEYLATTLSMITMNVSLGPFGCLLRHSGFCRLFLGTQRHAAFT